MIYANSYFRRVVVTGIGVVSPIGKTTEEFRHSLAHGTTGIKKLDESLSLTTPCSHAGYVADFQGKIGDFDHLDKVTRKKVRKALKVMSRETKMALSACTQALFDSEFDSAGYDPERVGVTLGTGDMTLVPDDFLGAVQACQDKNQEFDFSQWGTEGIPKVEPLWLLKSLPNMSACHIAIYHDFQGPNNSITQRETAANIAIAEAYRIISDGDADAMIVGGTGTTMLPMAYIHQLMEDDEVSNDNETCRPFDLHRSGSVAGEGAAMVVLEELNSALDRGAKIYGEICGTGSSTVINGSHQAKREQAVANVIKMALKNANASVDQVGHIHAHGLSTQKTDREEARAIRNIFGSRADHLPVTAMKSYTGNAGAGSGAMEFVASLLALQEDKLFPILNCNTPDPDCPISPVTNHDSNLKNSKPENSKPGNSFLNLSIVPHGQASSIYVEAFQE
jgi:3-oxoacyl-[acyl-carrier-protein] synthase II